MEKKYLNLSYNWLYGIKKSPRDAPEGKILAIDKIYQNKPLYSRKTCRKFLKIAYRDLEVTSNYLPPEACPAETYSS